MKGARRGSSLTGQEYPPEIATSNVDLETMSYEAVRRRLEAGILVPTWCQRSLRKEGPQQKSSHQGRQKLYVCPKNTPPSKKKEQLGNQLLVLGVPVGVCFVHFWWGVGRQHGFRFSCLGVHLGYSSRVLPPLFIGPVLLGNESFKFLKQA